MKPQFPEDPSSQHTDTCIRASIQIEGNVQGVGYRPFIYRLATAQHLCGRVRNSLLGVELEVEGPRAAVASFVASLQQGAPPLAVIERLTHTFLEPRGYEHFSIDASTAEGTSAAQAGPDVAVCSDCLSELFNPDDRRYLHPFISCTNCGPRFTIIGSVPYDRISTSMSCFEMCPECRREYDDPSCRRFHCQANACWECGPQVWLQLATDAHRPVGSQDPRLQRKAVERTVRLLKQGSIVAIKGVGGFHLACDATNAQAVATLRQRKRRVAKPFAMMVPDLETAASLCHVDAVAAELLSSPARPIVLLPRRNQERIAASVAGDTPLLGLMLPYAPLHYTVLFDESGRARFQALVMTSGNLADDPIVMTNREAQQHLGGLADAFLHHDRDILARADDSIVRHDSRKQSATPGTDLDSKAPTPIRRSRGYVPTPIRQQKVMREVLAVGGHLKNSIALSRGDQVFLSQHIGDLHHMESLGAFAAAVDHLQRLLGVTRPNVVAHDLHPDYLSTRYAKQLDDVQLVPVQHHHAHVASCMAEHGLKGPVIGLTLDGTGLGTDGRVWGGEVMIASYTDFQRAAHFREVRLPGNEQAIRQPWRMALSYLDALWGEDLWGLAIPFVRELDRPQAEVVLRAAQRAINAPLTTSCGRLFDAAAALVGCRQVNAYEGQAAMELEMSLHGMGNQQPQTGDAIRQDPPNVFASPMDPSPVDAPFVMDQFPLIEAVVSGIRKQLPRAEISFRFHRALTLLLARSVKRVADQSGVRHVVLTGGCFQNAHLKVQLTQEILDAGLSVWSHQTVPPNDGGLALGQLTIASRIAS